MTIYGYARVSTENQSLERQIANISRAHPEIDPKHLYTEKATGRSIDKREAFQRLLKKLKAGDVLVLDSVSRFSRDASQGFALYEDLFNKGIQIEFLKEPYINTSNYKKALDIQLPTADRGALVPLFEGIKASLMLLAKEQFKQAFDQAEKEVQDLRQRTREGMKAAGAADKIREAKTGTTYSVKKRDKAIEAIRKHSKDFGGSLSDPELIAMLGCSRNSFYKYKKAAKDN